jgi:hypothetical protein
LHSPSWGCSVPGLVWGGLLSELIPPWPLIPTTGQSPGDLAVRGREAGFFPRCLFSSQARCRSQARRSSVFTREADSGCALEHSPTFFGRSPDTLDGLTHSLQRAAVAAVCLNPFALRLLRFSLLSLSSRVAKPPLLEFPGFCNACCALLWRLRVPAALRNAGV